MITFVLHFCDSERALDADILDIVSRVILCIQVVDKKYRTLQLTNYVARLEHAGFKYITF